MLAGKKFQHVGIPRAIALRRNNSNNLSFDQRNDAKMRMRRRADEREVDGQT